MTETFAPTLRRFEQADFAALCGWFEDEQSLIQWGGPETRFPLDHVQLGAMLAEGKGDLPQRWLFSGQIGTSLIGHAQVALDWRHGVARMGRIAICPGRRGQGFGEAFIRLVLERILLASEFERIELNVYTFNTPAIRLYEKLGFVREGVRRAAVKVGAARWDTAIYGILRTDP